MIEAATKTCAACGGPVIRGFGNSDEFCSPTCFRSGRSFCKYCNKPLSQSIDKPKITFCNRLCKGRYYNWGAASPPYAAIEKRSTCKACGKPITQPKNGIKQFCNDGCGKAYRRVEARGHSTLQEWGGYPPETRRVLLELQSTGQMGLAKHLAIALDREYIQRKPEFKPNPYIICHCKTCGKEFLRKSWGHGNREYCSGKCQPKKREPLTGEKNPCAKLTWEQVDEIRYLHETKHLGCRVLARQYGVGKTLITNIITYRTWKPEHDPRHKQPIVNGK